MQTTGEAESTEREVNGYGTTSRLAFLSSTEFGPAMISKVPGSTTYFMSLSQSASASGPMVNLTVVVAPGASELILPIALAVTKGLTVTDLAQTFAIYPSLSGSITEAGRRLMGADALA